jgi:hypothetical protein
MDISCDYRDLFSIFNKHRVKYLIVGGYAVIFYTEPRFTKDVDIWVKPDIKNARMVYSALKEFEAPLKGVSWKTFTNKKVFYQVGMAPVRIDIIMDIAGLDFDFAWNRREKSKYADVSINIIGKEELKKSKLAVKRTQDLLDLEILRSVKRRVR